jgi:CRP/FNR family cyclic AMP-dependent transcriptional regulator
MSTQRPDQGPAASLREFLDRWSWYRTLSLELRSLVLDTATERTASPGEYIARAGEPATHWYGLMRGILHMYVVGVDGTETSLYCMRKGEWGGEGSLSRRYRRNSAGSFPTRRARNAAGKSARHGV